MRYPNLDDADRLILWAKRLVLQLERDFAALSPGKGTVTLTANAASTVITDANIGPSKKVLLFPKTANAAAAVATTYVADGNIGTATATITHANNAQADKTFDYVVI